MRTTKRPRGLKGDLIAFLAEKKDWIHKGEIQALTWTNKRNGTRYIPDNVGTCLRWLERNCWIAVRDDKNSKSVCYKYIPNLEDLPKRYIPTSDRPKGKEDVLFEKPKAQGEIFDEPAVSEEDIASYMNS